MNRGDRREPIFRDDADRNRFLATLGGACAKSDWQVHDLCLMENHFHLVLETPQANLVAGMKWFLGSYTARFNRRHRTFGHLFSGRYKALVVVAASPGYFRTVCEHVHLNPVRASLLAPEQALREYAWSSFPEYLKPAQRRWPWLRVDRLLGQMRLPKDSTATRREFEWQLEARRRHEGNHAESASIRRGWFFGDGDLKQELQAQAAEPVGPQHYGADRQESGESRTARGGGIEEVGLGGFRLGRAVQRGSRQSAHRPSVTAGDDDALGVGRGEIEAGSVDPRVEPAATRRA